MTRKPYPPERPVRGVPDRVWRVTGAGLAVLTRRVAAAAVLVALFAAAQGAPTRSAAASCHLIVPHVHAAASGGTVTGRVRGECSFRWHSVNQVMYTREFAGGVFRQPRHWHVLGSDAHPGGAPGEWVIQPADHDPYSGCGYWRLAVSVYRGAGYVTTILGPVSEFCASGAMA